MDRIQDSGSCDLGSNPGGITFWEIKQNQKPVSRMIYRFLCFLHNQCKSNNIKILVSNPVSSFFLIFD